MDSELEAIRDSLSQLQNHETIEKFAQVWREIGLEAHHRQDRRTTIVQHVGELLEEMLGEEELLKERMVESVRTCLLEMEQLEQELRLSTTHDDIHSNTLLEKERLSRSRVDALNKIKHDRMKRFKRLTEMEIALCKSLATPSQLSDKFQQQLVPSEEDLQSYRKRVELLESTKDSRQVEFRNTREKALEIWAELEMVPGDSMGKQLYEGNVSKFAFSEENMTCLEEYFLKVKKMAFEQEDRANKLRGSIVPLWVRLEIPGAFREEFLAKHPGYKSWMIKELESELDRLNMLKRDNLERFIGTVRAELVKYWDKCMYGQDQRMEFEEAFVDKFTDDSLSAHESELDRIMGFYADNVEVFKLVEKRDSMWRQKLEMEARASDPNRLKNRGGKLLQEQRQQQRVEREYPKIEAKVRQTVQQWEEDHCRHFLVHDTRYLDKLEEEIFQHSSAREQEKNKRQQVKAETTMMEMRFGTKHTPTSTKRKAACLTPSVDKTAKMRKVEPSPLMRATSSAARNRVTAKTKSKKITPTNKRRALQDKNIPSSCPAPSSVGTGSENSFINELSLASAGSYNEFQLGFVKGMETRKAARSSAIPKTSSVKNLAC